MKTFCDDCQKSDECSACKAKHAAVQAAADLTYDQIREAGYSSAYMMQLNEEAEERAARLGYQ